MKIPCIIEILDSIEASQAKRQKHLDEMLNRDWGPDNAWLSLHAHPCLKEHFEKYMSAASACPGVAQSFSVASRVFLRRFTTL